MTSVTSLPDKRFGAVWEPKNFDELIKLLRFDLHQGSSVYMWRGQSDARWNIDSAAYRRLVSSRSSKEKDVAAYEIRLLSEATHRGFRRLEGTELSDFELLARLQHQGAATRLLDTSRNALVALYFAVIDQPRIPGMLFGFHCWHLGGGEATPLKAEYKTQIALASKHAHPQTCEPPVISPRISAQHSQFLYSAIVDSPHGTLAVSDVAKNLLAIRLIPPLKRGAAKILRETFDIRLETLFPDLDGFGRANSVTRDEWSTYRW